MLNNFWGHFLKSLNNFRGEGQKWIVYKKRCILLFLCDKLFWRIPRNRKIYGLSASRSPSSVQIWENMK